MSSPSSYAGAPKSPRVVAPRVAFVSVPSSESNVHQNRDAEKTKGREKERSEPIEKGRERSYEHHQRGRESRERRGHVARGRERDRYGSVSGSGIGAVITGMSVRAMRTTTDLSMTGSDVIEAEKKIHLTKKRLQWIQVKSGKQYIVSTVSVNAIKI